MRHEVLIVVAALAVSQEREELSVEEELAALIEKTNALESFHASYDFRSTEEDAPCQATIEFVYVASEQGHLHFSGEKGDWACWIDETSYYFQSNLDDGDGKWRRAPFPDPPPAALLLNELFPRAEKLLGAGAFFDLKLRKSPRTENVDCNPTMGRKLSRVCLFGWLEEMQRRAAEVSVEEHSLVLDDDRCRYSVSRKSGLLERVDLSTSAGTLEIRLRECQLDEPLVGDLVKLPTEARSADLDPEMTRNFENLFGPGALRYEAFQRVERQLESERRPWNEHARSDWRTFLDALHRSMITNQKADWIEQLQEYVDQKAEWVSAQRARDDSPERRSELELEVAKGRAKLEVNFENARKTYVDELPAVKSKHGEPRQELFDIEIEVIADLWDELLSAPILKSYDEKLAEALGR